MNFGSQWKRRRWSQYSVRVQIARPATNSRMVVPTARPWSIPSQTPTTTTGMKTIAGMAGWTREKKSRNRLSNIGGEAESWLVRSCAIGADLSGRTAQPSAS